MDTDIAAIRETLELGSAYACDRGSDPDPFTAALEALRRVEYVVKALAERVNAAR